MAQDWRIKGFNPFYTTKLGAAYLGNSFEIMKNIPPDDIDLIITSPPYANDYHPKVVLRGLG